MDTTFGTKKTGAEVVWGTPPSNIISSQGFPHLKKVLQLQKIDFNFFFQYSKSKLVFSNIFSPN